MTFKIATWNINSVRLRIGLVERFLEEHAPDVLCLQEIKCVNDAFPAKAFRKAGYEHHAVHGQKGYHGVATVSKHPLRETASTDYCLMGDTRHVEMVVETGFGPIRMHNFYVPAGGDVPDRAVNAKFDHKLRFLDEMHTLDSEAGSIPAILVGDLNIAPLETDVWSHKQLLKVVSHTPVETDGLNAMQAAGGWTDLIRQHIPPTRHRLYMVVLPLAELEREQQGASPRPHLVLPPPRTAPDEYRDRARCPWLGKTVRPCARYRHVRFLKPRTAIRFRTPSRPACPATGSCRRERGSVRRRSPDQARCRHSWRTV